ncbi:MAG: hypothetical protein ACLR7D_06640 [Lachnospira eligens]
MVNHNMEKYLLKMAAVNQTVWHRFKVSTGTSSVICGESAKNF